MKNLKTYETYINSDNLEKYKDILSKYRFKIGDHIKGNGLSTSTNKKIFKIVSINTDDSNQPYQITQDNYIFYSTSGDNFEIVNDYELDAIKYNI